MQATESRPAASKSQLKRDWISEIVKTVKGRPTAAILYGVPGIGKTSMAANIPGVVFLTDDKEDGITTLKAGGLVPGDVSQFPPISSWDHTFEALDALRSGDHGFKAIALDALGGFESLMHQHVCKRDFGDDWTDKGFMGYMRGYDVSLADWRRFLNALDALRNERNMSVFLLAHAKVAPFHNPSGPDYDRYAVDMHHKTWSVTHRWADIVLFANYEVAFAKGDDLKRKAKAKGGQSRILYTDHTAAWDAKNRHNLPSEIDMGTSGAEAWSNFVSAIKAGRADAIKSQGVTANV